MKTLTALTLTALLCLLASPLVTPVLADEKEDAIKARSEEFVAAFNKHDADAMDDFFTDDASVTDPAGTKFEGKDKVKAYLANIAAGAERTATGSVTVKNVKVDGDNADLDWDFAVKGEHDSKDPDKATNDTYNCKLKMAMKGDKWAIASITIVDPTPDPDKPVKEAKPEEAKPEKEAEK